MRLIDADALMREFAEFVRRSNNSDFSDIPTWNDAVSLLGSAPTIEPKKGKWITKKDACGIGYQICSNCETEIQWRDRHGVILRVDMQNAPYCPYCGAKMEAPNVDNVLTM